MLIENVTVYRFSGAGPLAGLLAPAGVAAPAAAGAAAAAAAAGTFPNEYERLIPMFTEKNPGPMP